MLPYMRIRVHRWRTRARNLYMPQYAHVHKGRLLNALCTMITCTCHIDIKHLGYFYVIEYTEEVACVHVTRLISQHGSVAYPLEQAMPLKSPLFSITCRLPSRLMTTRALPPSACERVHVVVSGLRECQHFQLEWAEKHG